MRKQALRYAISDSTVPRMSVHTSTTSCERTRSTAWLPRPPGPPFRALCPTTLDYLVWPGSALRWVIGNATAPCPCSSKLDYLVLKNGTTLPGWQSYRSTHVLPCSTYSHGRTRFARQFPRQTALHNPPQRPGLTCRIRPDPARTGISGRIHQVPGKTTLQHRTQRVISSPFL